jgi:hypothetical protein
MGCLYSFIAGIPGETREESLETVRLARKLQSPRAIANVYFGTSIFPGTAFCAELEKVHGPIDWEHPAQSVRPLFSDDPFGNPTAPTITHPWEVVGELGAALGLPSLPALQASAVPQSESDPVDLDRLYAVQQWSPYLLPQLGELAKVLSSVAPDPQSKVLCVGGRSKESVLSVAIADGYHDVRELALPEPVVQSFPEADHMIDEAFGALPSGGFRLVVDLNTIGDLRGAVGVRVASHLRRVLASDGVALFFYQNPDHLVIRAGGIVGARKSMAAQRRPSIDAFRGMLESEGFAIEKEHSAGIGLPASVYSRLPFSTTNTLGAFRLPKSLGGWSLMVCRPGI